MKIYLAGHDSSKSMTKLTLRRRLHSYYHSSIRDMKADAGHGVEVALDSGAFTAWSKGSPIKLDSYITFLHEFGYLFSWYANLDVIGDAQATWDNQKAMEAQGLSPVPCFHYGEDFKWLYRYMDDYEYIALGGMVGKGIRPTRRWLHRVFCATIRKGIPIRKFHAYGATSLDTIRLFPWYSVDSSTWLLITGWGNILVPPPDGTGGFNYHKPAWNVGTFAAWPPGDKLKNIWSMKSRDVKRAQHVERYIAHQGFRLGVSRVRYRPRNGLSWIGEKPINEHNGAHSTTRIPQHFHHKKIAVEVVEKRGLCNDLYQRRQFVANYFAELEDAYPWPRTYYRATQGARGFHYDHS